MHPLSEKELSEEKREAKGGNKILKQYLAIIEVLSELVCFDLDSFLIGQNDIWFKMVVSVLRLLSVSCTDEEQDEERPGNKFELKMIEDVI